MNILIYDDNIEVAQNLKNNINQLYPEAKIKTFDSRTAIEKAITRKTFPIVILDIMVENRPLGIEISNAIYKKNPVVPIIFYSGYSTNLYNVYDSKQHIYFLEKPFDKLKMRKAFQKAIEQIDNNMFWFQFAAVTKRIPFNQIYAFESQDRRIIIHLTSEKIKNDSENKQEKKTLIETQNTLYFYKKLNDVEKEINYRFIRTSKSILINPEYITQIKGNMVFIEFKRNENDKETQKTNYVITRSYLKRVQNNELLMGKY